MKIYTKTGDTGDTGLYGGRRISKDDKRVETYGTIDELNACIGFAESQIQDDETCSILTRIQNELFDLGADLATPIDHPKAEGLRITPELTTSLERLIDRFQGMLPPMTHFVFCPAVPRGGRRCTSLGLSVGVVNVVLSVFQKRNPLTQKPCVT